MQEDGVDVYIRHREELLKAIIDNSDASQEAGDFLLSTINLHNHNIEYDLTQDDLICLSYSQFLLKTSPSFQELSFSEGVKGGNPMGHYRPALLTELGTPHPWEHRVKRHFTKEDNDKHGHSLYKPREDGEPVEHYLEKNRIPPEIRHALWPTVMGHSLIHDGNDTSRLDTDHYRDIDPFGETHHPIRRRRSDTNMPEWENTLKNFYFDKDGGESYAERSMGIEDAHKKHWSEKERDQTHGIYSGAAKGGGGRTYPFVGGGDDGHESDTKHQHSMRLRDYKRWVADEIGHKRAAELEKEGVDLERMHFDERMGKLDSHDIMPVTRNLNAQEPTKKEILAHLMENPNLADEEEAKSDLIKRNEITTNHGHGMGWETYNYGLEFLNPEERSAVINHIHEHGTDDPEHQSVQLPDGQRMFMSRIKKNFMHRNGVEDDWFSRSTIHPGPNGHANPESADDTKISGMAGIASRALKQTYLKDGMVHDGEPYEWDDNDNKKQMFDNTAFDELREGIEGLHDEDHLLHHGSDTDTDNEREQKKNLFPFESRDIADIEKKLNAGADLKEALKGKVSENSDVQLTPEGLMKLVGWDKNYNYEGPSSIFKNRKEALLPKDIMQSVMQNVANSSAMTTDSKSIRNASNAHRTNINTPHKEDIPEEEHAHYYEEDGELRGLQHPFALPFTHRGGLGKQKTTHNELVHDHLGEDDKWTNISIPDGAGGEKKVKMNLGASSSILGVKNKDGSIDSASGTVGLTSQMLPHFLPTGVQSHHTAQGVMAKTDTSMANIGKRSKGRNIKNASDMHNFSRSPAVTRLLRSGTPKGLTVKDKTAFDFGGAGFMFDNQYTRTNYGETNKDSRVVSRGDTSVKRNAAHSWKMGLLNGRLNPPNAPIERPYSYKDFINRGMQIIPESIDYDSLISEMPNVRKPKDKMWAQQSPPDKKGKRRDLFGFQEELQEQYDLLDRAETKQERKEITAQIDKLNEESRAASEKDIQAFKGAGQYEKINSAKIGDERAAVQLFRTKIRPMIEKENPNAFHPNNPMSLTNLHVALGAAQKGLHVNDSHGLSSRGFHVDRGIEEEVSSDAHFNLATIMNSSAKFRDAHTIGPNTEVKRAMTILGLPDDSRGAHREYVKHWLSTLGGDVVGLSVGKLAGLGIPWNTNNPDMFSDLIGRDDIHGHLDTALENDKRTWGPSRDKARNRPNKEYEEKKSNFDKRLDGHNAIDWMGNFVHGSPNKLSSYGLDLHRPPAAKKSKRAANPGFDSRDGRTLLHPAKPKTIEETHGRVKDIASQILSYDTAIAPEELRARAPTVTTNKLSFKGDAPIKSLGSRDGIAALDVINGGNMDWGYPMQGEFGIEWDANGEPVYGQHPQTAHYNTMPRSMLSAALQDTHQSEHVQSIYDNSIPLPQTSALTSIDAFGQSSYEDREQGEGWKIVGKAELPKEVPLIEPLHRIFDIEDLTQLRGFTGEWVVSAHKEGVRCKVIKKSNRITMNNESGEKQSTGDDMRAAFKSICKKDYVIDGVLSNGIFYVNDILLYDDDEITELTTRERLKILRGQFDSYDPVHIPSPSDIRVTDDVGLKDAVKELSKESDMILLRDAKSTYMKGEEKHPKWVMLAKAEIDYHIPFTMEIDDSRFIIHLPEDIVKYDIIDGVPASPVAAIGQVTNSDYSIRLAKSLEPYWKSGFAYLHKEETQIEPEIDEERIEEESAGILKPKKDKNLIMKPKELYKTVALIERALEVLEKGHSNMAGRGLGIDVGGGVESPRGPTRLVAEQSLPDWDMKDRPTEDSEKAEDYPGRKKKKKETAAQSIDYEE